MKHTVTITSGELVEGDLVEGISRGIDGDGSEVYTSSWTGTFDGLSTHDGEHYAYFRDGHVNGKPQAVFGFPVSRVITG